MEALEASQEEQQLNNRVEVSGEVSQEIRSVETSRISDSELEMKVRDIEERIEILLEELAQATEEDLSQELVTRIELKLAVNEKKLGVWRKLHEFRLSRRNGVRTDEFLDEIEARNASKLSSNSWRVPTNLPVFRSSKGMEDPLEFVEKFERVCEANGIQLGRYIKLISLCLDVTDVQWVNQWVKANGVNGEAWSDFKEMFISHFQYPNSMVVWQAKIMALKMDNSGVQ